MAKRGASYQLTDQNWAEEEELVEAGIFETASVKEMSKRVIKKAKRVSRAGEGGDAEESSGGNIGSAFSGFKGLAKPSNMASSMFQIPGKNFKPLAGLNSDGNTVRKTQSATNFSFSSKYEATEPTPVSSSVFGHKSTPFIFGVKKTTFGTNGSEKKENEDTEEDDVVTESPLKRHFGNGDTDRPKTAASAFKFKTSPSTTTATEKPVQSPRGQTSPAQGQGSLAKGHGTTAKPQEYHKMLAGLNRAVCDWIKKHVDRNPLCDLTPVFGDYEKHLKELDDRYPHTSGSESEPLNDNAPATGPGVDRTYNTSLLVPQQSNVFSAETQPSASSASVFNKPSSFQNEFSFGSSSQSSSFQVSSSSQDCSQDLKEEETNRTATAEDEPPNVEFTENTEEGAFYSKKCKLFVMKGPSFVERGVGMLHIKFVEDKTQLLIRAGTTLGNLLLNIVLTPTTPVSRSGKNNVMLVCAAVPPTEMKCPKCRQRYSRPSESSECVSGCIADPATMLIRVKTAEDADELHDKINAFK